MHLEGCFEGVLEPGIWDVSLTMRYGNLHWEATFARL